MAILFDGDSLPVFEARVCALTEDSTRLWGKMPLPVMLRHLRFNLELSLGEAHLPDTSIPVLRRAVFYVFFRWFTRWPRARIKAPQSFFPEVDGGFEVERQALLAAMRRFAERAQAQPGVRAVMPLLGPLPMRDWAYVHGAHCNHHLRQFSV